MTTSASRRQALRAMGALALGLGARELAFGAAIVAVRVWPAEEYTRVTIESDAPLAEKHFLADNPSRLVIDVDGLELSPQLRELVGKVKPDDPFIAGVRVGQSQPRVVRLVLDLKQATAPQLFTLAPVAAYRHRLVFDLHPVKEPDPLLALIRDKEQAEAKAAQSVQDALGEFIGRMNSAAAAARRPHQRRRRPGPRAGRAAGAARCCRRRSCRRCWRSRRSTGWSSSPSIPATAARTRARSARAGCARRTWCWRSRCSCATGSTPTRRCGRC
jgi:N-acetylmuramoyl-L-alanine amidase